MYRPAKRASLLVVVIRLVERWIVEERNEVDVLCADPGSSLDELPGEKEEDEDHGCEVGEQEVVN